MKLNFFLYLPLEDELLLPLAEDAVRLEQTLEDVGNLIDFLQTDKDVSVFHDRRNVEGFLKRLEGWLDDKSRLTNPRTSLRLRLRGYPDVQDKSQADHQSSYYSWHYNKGEVYPENGSILAEIAERVLASSNHQAKFVVLTLGDTAHSSAAVIPVFKDNDRDTELPKFVLIEYVFGLWQAFNWLNKNRKPRKFKKHPEKHGESGVGKRKSDEVSPLLCSEVEAHTLLQTAIGYARTTELYNLDDTHDTYKKYIVFKFEGEYQETTYHGYHPENEAEVPPDVRDQIEKIRSVKPSM